MEILFSHQHATEVETDYHIFLMFYSRMYPRLVIHGLTDSPHYCFPPLPPCGLSSQPLQLVPNLLPEASGPVVAELDESVAGVEDREEAAPHEEGEGQVADNGLDLPPGQLWLPQGVADTGTEEEQPVNVDEAIRVGLLCPKVRRHGRFGPPRSRKTTEFGRSAPER